MKKCIFFSVTLFLVLGIHSYTHTAAAAEDVKTQRQNQLGEQLIEAIFDKNIEKIKQLIVEGASAVNYYYKGRDQYDLYKGSTPLRIALTRRNNEIVNILLDARADVNDGGKNQEAPLITVAGFSNELSIVKTLLNAHAYIDIQDKGGNTALMYATAFGHNNIIKELILSGADVDLVNKKSETAWTIKLINLYNSLSREQVTSIMQQAVEEKQQRVVIIGAYLPVVIANIVRDYLEAKASKPILLHADTIEEGTEKEEEEMEEVD